MELRKAYRKMILNKKDKNKLRMKEATLYPHRSRVRKGVYPSKKVMEDRLKRAGWYAITEALWTKEGEDMELLAELKRQKRKIEDLIKKIEP